MSIIIANSFEIKFTESYIINHIFFKKRGWGRYKLLLYELRKN